MKSSVIATYFNNKCVHKIYLAQGEGGGEIEFVVWWTDVRTRYFYL